MKAARLALALCAGALIAAPTHVAAQQPATFAPREETPEQWPAGNGRDETFHMCTACHATGIITRAGQTREGWDELITQMVTRHNMAEPDAAFRKLLLDYLAEAFPRRVQPGSGWRNPFAPN